MRDLNWGHEKKERENMPEKNRKYLRKGAEMQITINQDGIPRRRNKFMLRDVFGNPVKEMHAVQKKETPRPMQGPQMKREW